MQHLYFFYIASINIAIIRKEIINIAIKIFINVDAYNFFSFNGDIYNGNIYTFSLSLGSRRTLCVGLPILYPPGGGAAGPGAFYRPRRRPKHRAAGLARREAAPC